MHTGDLDDENGPDIAVAVYSSNNVVNLYNDGAGGFTPDDPISLDGPPIDLVVVDVEPDGDLDIVVCTFSEEPTGTVTLLRNEGGRHFVKEPPYNSLAGAAQVIAGSLNPDQDNRPDLAVVSWNSAAVAVLYNDGHGGFLDPVVLALGGNPHIRMSIADIDGDTDNDIVLPCPANDLVSILRYNGNKAFLPVEEQLVCDHPRGIALSDLNGDESPDLVLQASDVLSVSFNSGDGSFQYGQATSVTQEDPNVLATDDVDMNRVADVCALNAGIGATVLHNDGLGGFPTEDYYTMTLARNVQLADLDNDRGPDLIVLGGPFVQYRHNLGNGAFGERLGEFVQHAARGCCVGHFDDDGFPDIAVSYRIVEGPGPEWVKDSVVVFVDSMPIVVDSFYVLRDDQDDPLETGIAVLMSIDGRDFEDPIYYPLAGLAAMHIVAADVDYDGDIDVCVAGESYNLAVFRNNGEGVFTPDQPYATGAIGCDIAAGYLNGDPYPDIVVSDLSQYVSGLLSGVSVLLNDGSGCFPPNLQTYYRTGQIVYSCEIADVNGDGRSDILTAHHKEHNGAVLLNNGAGTFAVPHYCYGYRYSPLGLAVSDIDDDGDVDVLYGEVHTGANPVWEDFVVYHPNTSDNLPKSTQPDMTYPTSSRHIARAPNTHDLDWVWQSNHRVFYRNRCDITWGPISRIAVGNEPAVAKNDPGRPWVVYTTGSDLCLSIFRADGTWRNDVLNTHYFVKNPGVVLSKILGGALGDMGYAVYSGFHLLSNTEAIYFCAFDSMGVYYTEAMDYVILGDPPVSLSSPSLSIIPGDYLQVSWEKGGVVYFRTTQLPVDPDYIRYHGSPTWLPAEPISDAPTQPGSHTFCEADGELVFGVWRGPNAAGQNVGEIYRRRGTFIPGQRPNWYLYPVNESNTPADESDNPVMSTSMALVWEQDPPLCPGIPEIVGIVDGVPVTLSNTPGGVSRLPHTELSPAPLGMQQDWQLFTIWTEQESPGSQYEVVHDDYYFGGDFGDTSAARQVLSVRLGDSVPSHLCLQRGGFDRSGKMNVDFAASSLVYRIPFMNPRMHYLLEIVGYQRTDKDAEQRISLSDSVNWKMTLEYDRPETLRVVVPPELYRRTTMTLRADRTKGQRVALAAVKLYEFEVVEQGKGGEQSQSLAEKPAFSQVFPNPFQRAASISFALPLAQSVSLQVYDISGRVVRTLVSGPHPAGVHSVTFDGTGDDRRKLAAGVYLVRLETADETAVRKLVLTK
ncbi:MAG: VCBS repeat-containing protein [candidate division WOR-3 bacterium]|nr:MAG: VCBS repeat-containing protein [candidate division WOR-3 bacterium]